ncbi:MAG: hypothetical protein ACTSU5_16080 [Promethearchaeota archaeon]
MEREKTPGKSKGKPDEGGVVRIKPGDRANVVKVVPDSSRVARIKRDDSQFLRMGGSSDLASRPEVSSGPVPGTKQQKGGLFIMFMGEGGNGRGDSVDGSPDLPSDQPRVGPPEGFDWTPLKHQASQLADYLDLLAMWFEEVLKNANRLQRKDLLEKFDAIYKKLERNWWIQLAPVDDPASLTNEQVAEFIAGNLEYIRAHFNPRYYFCPACGLLFPLYFDAPESTPCPKCGRSLSGSVAPEG